MFIVSHLIFVFNLYEERESKADLRQLRDEDAVFRAVKSGRIIVLIDQQDGEGGHDCGSRGRAVIIQFSSLERNKKCYFI